MNGAARRALTCLGAATPSASSGDSGPLGPSHPHPSCPPLIQVDGNILLLKKANKMEHVTTYESVLT